LSQEQSSNKPRLILGPPAELELALAETVKSQKAGDPLAPVTILVGNTLLRPYLQRRLATMLGGWVNVQMLTFAELGLKLGEPALVAEGRRPLPRLAAQVLAHEVARGAGDYFKPVADTPGFALALQRLFQELRQTGIEPPALSEAVAGDGPKQTEIAALFAIHEDRRARFYDPDDCIAHADPAVFNSRALLVHGVWQPTTIQRRLLEAVMTVAEITFFLPVTGTDDDQAHAEMRAWLRGLGIEPESRDPVQPDAPVQLLSAPDPPREVLEAARACLRWARDGIAFHETAVVYRHADRYRPLIESVFGDSGIPLYIHAGVPLTERPLGRRALALLDLIGSPAPLQRSAVMEFLTDADLPKETRDRCGGVSSADWDSISRKAGVVEGREEWLQRPSLWLEEEEKERVKWGREPREWIAEQVDRLTKFITELAERLEAHPKRAPWSDHVAYLGDLFRTYINDVEPVVNALADLSRLDPFSEQVDFERFRQVARRAIEEMRSEDPPEGRDGKFARQGVNVLDVNSIQHLRFRAVAVLGLTERAFPPPPRQDALLLDGERRALNEARTWDIPLRATGSDREPLQFAMAEHAAEEHLQLSFARTETGDTSPKLPSHFFRSAAAALKGEPVSVEDVDGLPEEFFTRIPGSRFAAPSLAEALTPSEYDRTLLADQRELGLAALAARSPEFVRSRTAQAARWESRELTVYDGVMSDRANDALAARASLDHRSASGIGTYAECPYRYFLHNLLDLEPEAEPDRIERLDALNRGTLVHRVLERFLRECEKAKAPPSLERRDEHLTRLRVIAGEEYGFWERRGLTGLPVIWRFDRRTITDDLVFWYDHELAEERAFDSGEFELSFGMGEVGGEGALSIPEPLEFDANGVTLQFRGFIDRVNWRDDKSAFRVIDYKTGRNWDKEEGGLLGGRALQLPIYLLAASRALGIPWERGEAHYFHITTKGGFERVSFDGRHLADRYGDFERLLHDYAEAIGRGDFHPVPGAKRKHCKYCNFHDLCDARVEMIADRKSEDPRAIAFAELAEIP